ncbi:MAG: hypothetical protein IGS03_00330 [Candidatus Sericytochromatia bacterium]|nr:hypothetical protein [Candidatus Sericytochromatia bacterium]
MSLGINPSRAAVLVSHQPTQYNDSFDAAVAAGVTPVSVAGGQQLEEVAMLAKGWREAVAAADQGMRSLQVK